MLPRQAYEHTFSRLKSEQGAATPKKGQSIRDAQNPTVIQHDPFALRIVVVMSHSQNKYYALFDEKRGLSEGQRVDLEHVFFFSTFRDNNVASREKRGES